MVDPAPGLPSSPPSGLASDRTRAPVDAASQGLPRAVDAALALAGLWATGALLAAAAAAIKATSPGPVFFRQRRVGRDGAPFDLWKLRSMTVQVPGAGPQITAGDDRRVTAVGRLLRRSKLDELPGLWNVLRGDMALVGPRPEVPRYVDLADPLWREVLATRPGLTDPTTLRLRDEESLLGGLQGDRDAFYRNTLLRWKLQQSAAYLRRRTWRSDVGVLFATARAIVRPSIAPPPTGEELQREVHGGAAAGERGSGGTRVPASV